MLVPSFLRFLCIFIIYCGNDCLVQKKVTTIFYVNVIKTRHILLLKNERKSLVIIILSLLGLKGSTVSVSF